MPATKEEEVGYSIPTFFVLFDQYLTFLTELFTCVSVLAFRSQTKPVTPRLVSFGFNSSVFEEHPHTLYTSNARVMSKPLPAGLCPTLKH